MPIKKNQYTTDSDKKFLITNENIQFINFMNINYKFRYEMKVIIIFKNNFIQKVTCRFIF